MIINPYIKLSITTIYLSLWRSSQTKIKTWVERYLLDNYYFSIFSRIQLCNSDFHNLSLIGDLLE